MCENYEEPSESGKTQADGHRTTAELDSSLFNGESPVQISERTRALHCEAWEKFFDKDGRVVNESAFRKAVFKGNFWPIPRPPLCIFYNVNNFNELLTNRCK